MDKKEMGKAASLLIAVVVCLLTLKGTQDFTAVGIYTGCGISGRLLYPFYHVNLFHSILNVWCMLSVVFIYDVSLWRLVSAYIISASIPSLFLSTVPTIGLSGVVFTLFGSISFEVRRKSYYQLWMIAYLMVGFISPNTNAWVHLYCYMAGVTVALLNKPIKVG